MKNTWIYRGLQNLQEKPLDCDSFSFKSAFFTSIALPFITVTIATIVVIIGFIYLLISPLMLIKDIYDIYYKLTEKRRLRKEEEEKQRKLKEEEENLKSDLKTWLNGYKERLTGKDFYILIHKITGEKLEIQYKNITTFLYYFLVKHNLEFNTYYGNYLVCGVNRRRSINDLYLISKYYFPTLTLEELILALNDLIGDRQICTQYCTTINKYVFYSTAISSHHSTAHSLEFTNNSKLNFYNLIKYLKDEQKNKNLSSLSRS